MLSLITLNDSFNTYEYSVTARNVNWIYDWNQTHPTIEVLFKLEKLDKSRYH